MGTNSLDAVRTNIQRRFDEGRQILSFGEYFEIFCSAPRQHGRNVAQYLVDVFDFYGEEEIQRSYGARRRFRLFDAEFDQGLQPLVGQEEVQTQVYSVLQRFVQQGRIDKLLLLHGPNGSAKSTLINCLIRAMEHYSRRPEGALYRFNWVFPTEKLAKKGIGFSEGAASGGPLESYAHLDHDSVEARLMGDVSDPPIFLIPANERQDILDSLIPADDDSFTWSEYVRQGELSQRSRQIFEALLTAYHGDYSRVLRHVQVERMEISHRYRRGAVTVEPQLSVDAGVRQVTMDRSHQSLPPSLQNLTLFEPYGDLVDANRGLLEFNDLFKRPVEAYKYILSTCEKSTVNLENANLFLDCFFIGSANEKHLEHFKQIPDFQAFKGRIELIQVPYLRNWRDEERIYAFQAGQGHSGRKVAPHTTAVAALWAVLTRLRKPQPERYSKQLKELVGRLTPSEKAALYAEGRAPQGIAVEVANELRTVVSDLWTESETYPGYEGRLGASPREVKTLLHNASQLRSGACLSPLAVFDVLEELVEERSVYEFLQIEPVGDYHQPRAFIDVVRSWYLDVLANEIRECTGLIDSSSYTELLDRYVHQLKHHIQGEKVKNPVTGRYEDPDTELMVEVESKLAIVGSPKEFRHQFFNRIGAWGHENPGKKVILNELFAKELQQLREAYYGAQATTLSTIYEAVLTISGDKPKPDQLDEELRQQATRTLENMNERCGYCDSCAREAISYLLKEQHATDA